MLGRRHDVGMVGESGLVEHMQQWFNDAAESPYYIYGDPAYQMSPWLMTPFNGALTPPQQAFNRDERLQDHGRMGFR